MNRQPLRLIDLFAHWRDQHLYDLQVAIRHLGGKTQLTPEDLQDAQLATILFNLDDRGRPMARRHETSLKSLLERYIGLVSTLTVPIGPLLRALRLERERRLRYLLRNARSTLWKLLDPAEVARLQALPVLAPGPSPEVARLLRVAAVTAPRALRDYPATGLARLLPDDAIQAVIGEVHAALGWGPRQTRAAALSIQDLALLTLVLPWAVDPTGDWAGFEFFAQSRAGVAVGDLLTAMQAHLIPGLSGCPAQAFGLVRYLLGSHAPAELSVLGLPQELAWATSTTWVLLSHGVTLAEVIIPETGAELSFNEALELPAKLAEGNDSAYLSKALAAALMPGLARWNEATQHVARLPLPLALERAASTFLEQLNAMDRAANALQRAMPERLQMAREELKARGIAADMRFVEAHDRVHQSLVPGLGISALQAVGSGLAAGLQPPRVPALVIGHNGRLHEPWCNPRNIPDIPARFEAAFAQWKGDAAHAVSVMTERLLADLPLADRQRLEQHPVTLCQLARRLDHAADPEIASYGFVLHVHTADEVFCYALLPAAAWCRVRAFAGSELPLPRLEGQTGDPYPLPFDWEAFAQGGLPDPQASFTGWLEPVIRIPASGTLDYQVFASARQIARQCQHQIAATLAKLYLQAHGTLPGEVAKEFPEAVKALVPFWSSIEAIQQGVEEKRGWLVALGLIGIGLEIISLGAWGRLSALSIRFVSLALRKGARQATRLLAPRLRSAAKDALETLLPVGVDPQAATPVADLGLLLSVRRSHGALLKQTARRLTHLNDGQRALTAPALAPLSRPALYVKPLEDDTLALITAVGTSKGDLHRPRLVNPQTMLPYGPALDIIDDTQRLGRLPIELPVTVIDNLRYVPDPAPSLPKRWIGWGDETWLECSGRFYRLREATATRPAALEQAPSPFARPPLEHPSCRVRRTLSRLVCAASGDRVTQDFTELNEETVVPPGAVDWFDQRKVTPAGDGRFVDGNLLKQAEGNEDRILRKLTWDDYRGQISVRRLVGNDIFQRIEVVTGLIDGVEDSRALFAVQVRSLTTEKLHMVTCVDDGVFYHGEISHAEGPFTLHKLPRGDSPAGEEMTAEEELKFLYNGCWDANHHIRKLPPEVVTKQLEKIENTLAKGVNIDLPISERFALSTTPAQAALFAKYPRRSFIEQTREFIASDYTHPITAETPKEVRDAIATHLNNLTKSKTFDANKVLDPVAIANAPPKGKNIAFLELTYQDGRPAQVYYSVSGARQRRTDLPLAKEAAGMTVDDYWDAEDGTRYINCRGEGKEAGAEALIHIPDLSQASNLNTGDINDRQLDSERNILAGIRRAGLDTKEAASATLFTRLPTCDSCTTLLAEFREQFPGDSFKVYEGPLPARTGSEPLTPPS